MKTSGMSGKVTMLRSTAGAGGSAAAGARALGALLSATGLCSVVQSR
jgi:hypothetical protein